MNYKMKKMYGGTKKKMMQKGGAKPDYLDMDGDGNKKESMKSAVASKKKMQMGGMGKASKRISDKLTKDKLTKTFGKVGKAMTAGKVTGKAANNKGKKMKMGDKKKMGMGGNKIMKYQAGGFLEPPVYDLDA